MEHPGEESSKNAWKRSPHPAPASGSADTQLSKTGSFCMSATLGASTASPELQRRDFCPFLWLQRADSAVPSFVVFSCSDCSFCFVSLMLWSASHSYHKPFLLINLHFWLAIIVFLYFMFWVAPKLNGVLSALCSALQSSSCVSRALTNYLSHPDTKTGHSCFPRSFK